MASGVYKITCIATCETYVGSAIDIARQWSWDQRLLRNGKHPNQNLQRLWLSHGEAAFSLETLELVGPEKLVDKELEYIKDLSPSLNEVIKVNVPVKSTAPVKVERKTTTVRLDESILDHLKVASLILRRSQSDVMNDALKEYFDRYKLGCRYQLHVHGHYTMLMKVDKSGPQIVEVNEINGLSPKELVEKYRQTLGEPVEFVGDAPGGSGAHGVTQ